MADSNITKQALARALKELMQEMPFDKINVVQICERCNMSRKSFYYHFKDKYDLVNWIFDVELYALAGKYHMRQWKFLETVCEYFDSNRDFYRKVMQFQGQNSFSEHFRESLRPLIYTRVSEIVESGKVHPICIDFFVDGIVCAIERWLLTNDSTPPQEFAHAMKSMIQVIATYYQRRPGDYEPE